MKPSSKSPVSRKIGVTALAALVGLSLAGCGKSSDATGSSNEEILVGALYESTGDLSALGATELRAAQLRIDEVNAAGGIDGKKLKLVSQDTKSTSSGAVTGARALIQKKVVAVIGPASTATLSAVGDSFNKAKIPVISCEGGQSLGGTPQTEYLFGAGWLGTDSAAAVKAELEKKNISKIGFMTTSDALGDAGTKMTNSIFGADGAVTIVKSATMQPTDTSASTQMAGIKDAGLHDIWLFGSSPAVITAIVSAFADHGLTGHVWGHTLTQDLVTSLGAAGSKYIAVAPPTAIQPEDGETGPVADFYQQYTKAYGESPNAYSACGHDAVSALVEGLKSGASSSQELQKTFSSGFTWTGLNGKHAWTADDHVAYDPSQDEFYTVDVAAKKFVRLP